MTAIFLTPRRRFQMEIKLTASVLLAQRVATQALAIQTGNAISWKSQNILSEDIFEDKLIHVIGIVQRWRDGFLVSTIRTMVVVNMSQVLGQWKVNHLTVCAFDPDFEGSESRAPTDMECTTAYLCQDHLFLQQVM